MSQKLENRFKPKSVKKIYIDVEIHLDIKTITREFDPGSG